MKGCWNSVWHNLSSKVEEMWWYGVDLELGWLVICIVCTEHWTNTVIIQFCNDVPSHGDNAWLVPVLLCSRTTTEAHFQVALKVPGEERVRRSAVYDELAATVPRPKSNRAIVGTTWLQSSWEMPDKCLTLMGIAAGSLEWDFNWITGEADSENAKDLQGCHGCKWRIFWRKQNLKSRTSLSNCNDNL